MRAPVESAAPEPTGEALPTDAATPAEGSPPRRPLTLSTRILLGLVAGLAVGLFIGERASALQGVADAYVRLLQMSVLPYVTFSLVAGLGSLSRESAGRLGRRVGFLVLLLWAVAIVAVLLFPLVFPSLPTGTFFSTTLVEEDTPFDIVGLYIPANPFQSLATNAVPAVVLFSVLAGIALIGVPQKERILEVLDGVNAMLTRVTLFVVSLTPYGIFAIGAAAAGTLTLEDAARIQVYLVSYVVVSLLLSLWVLPGLVAALTPVPYRAIVSRTRDALLTAFMTSSLFAVLPMLTESAKELLREHAKTSPADAAATDVIIPASFSLPHAGKLLALSFVLFAGWYVGAEVPLAAYPQLVVAGILSLFGNVTVAVPFLLDLFKIPADTFQLFLATSIVNARFGTLLSAAYTLALAILGTCALTGSLAFDLRRMLRFVAITAVLVAAGLGGSRVALSKLLEGSESTAAVLDELRLRTDDVQTRVFGAGDEAPALSPPETTVLDRVRERGILRVGFFEGTLPFSFTNRRGELVGFDVEMAHRLAHDLGVSLELVPLARSALGGQLDPATCDLVMSGVAVTSERSLGMLFSDPYLEETLAFVVPDPARAEFGSWEALRTRPSLRIAVPRAPYYAAKIKEKLPNAEIVFIDDIGSVLEQGEPEVDAVAATAERGSAYTLLHPEYAVAVPKPGLVKIPIAYVIAGRDRSLREVVDAWIGLKRSDGSIDELFQRWILGRAPETRVRRWSILDDVL